MTNQDDPDAQPSTSEPEPTTPEVLRYGPPPTQPTPTTWNRPSWSRPSDPSSANRRGGLGTVPVVTIALVTAVISGSLSAAAVANLLRPTSGSTLNEPTGSSVSQVHIDESSAVITAVARVMPAVVVIQSSSSGGVLGGANGIGSGFIFDSNGWILTNKHVVDGATSLTVILSDSRELSATLYGIDPLTDLAIIKVDSSGLPTVSIGSSSELKPGQLAIAIGNPLGEFENTVTTGVISGLGRQIVAGDSLTSNSEQLNNLNQTDAAINPGNSGGPLINSAGQVIGINTAVSQEAQGIGFAIPIDVAKPIMQQAVNGQELSRPWIGVFYQPVTKQLADERNLSVDYGVLIDSSNDRPAVFPDSPAAQAGLQAGDVITAVDGDRVDADSDLADHILPHQPGDQITLTVIRDGRQMDVTVTLGTLPEQP